MSEKQFPQRKSPRLQGYDYAQSGAYFVTICTHNRACLFGDVVNGAMVLSNVGEIAHQEIREIPEYWPGWVDIDGAVVMPNHVHMIVVLVGTPFLAFENRPPASQTDTQKGGPTAGNMPPENRPPASQTDTQKGVPTAENVPSASQTDTQKRAPTLGNVIGNYKAGVTRLARRFINDDAPIWQARYHDHIIRNEQSLTRIREYVLYNPARWQDDRLNDVPCGGL